MKFKFLSHKTINFGVNIVVIMLLMTLCYKQFVNLQYLNNPLVPIEVEVDIYKHYLGLEFIFIIGLIVLSTISFLEKYKTGSVIGILLIVFGIIKLIY